MNQLLNEWLEQNQPSDEMGWKEAFWNQVNFVRTNLASILARNYKEYRSLVKVAGIHTSKSIVCPVYYIRLEKEGVDIWMRYNFFNWNVSIQSDVLIDCDFLGTANDESYGYCFCEGMEQWKFGKIKDSKSKFTVCIRDHYDCYTFFRVLRKYLGITLDE